MFHLNWPHLVPFDFSLQQYTNGERTGVAEGYLQKGYLIVGFVFPRHLTGDTGQRDNHLLVLQMDNTGKQLLNRHSVYSCQSGIFSSYKCMSNLVRNKKSVELKHTVPEVSSNTHTTGKSSPRQCVGVLFMFL